VGWVKPSQPLSSPPPPPANQTLNYTYRSFRNIPYSRPATKIKYVTHTRGDFCRHLPSVDIKTQLPVTNNFKISPVSDFTGLLNFPSYMLPSYSADNIRQGRTLACLASSSLCTLDCFSQLQSKCIALFGFIIQQITFHAPQLHIMRYLASWFDKTLNKQVQSAVCKYNIHSFHITSQCTDAAQTVI